MKLWSNRMILAASVLSVAWLAAAVAVSVIPVSAASRVAPGAGQASADAKPQIQMAEEAFKNVLVLKGIPVDQFMQTMGVFTTSLSLDCTACHTGAGTSNPKWEDDPPRKRTARTMIRMVQALNRDSFGGRQVVTCWTCHRGMLSPAVTPPLDFAYGEPVAVAPDLLPRATSGVPTVDQILEKYIQALGGAARVNGLTSYVAKGTSILYGEIDASPAEIYAKAPNQLAMFIHERDGDVARTYDGGTGWFQLPLTVVPQYPLTASALEGDRFDGTMAFPWRVKDFFTSWRVSYPTTLDGRAVNVIQGNDAGLIATLYLDKETGLVKRMLRYTNSAVGRVPTQIDYSDFRPVAGVLMPFKFSYTWVSQREEWTLTEYQPNVAIEASRFDRPASRTAAR